MVLSKQFGNSILNSQTQPVDDCLHHLFEAKADEFPLAPAILQRSDSLRLGNPTMEASQDRGSANDDPGAMLTYGEVEDRANKLAHYLRH